MCIRDSNEGWRLLPNEASDKFVFLTKNSLISHAADIERPGKDKSENNLRFKIQDVMPSGLNIQKSTVNEIAKQVVTPWALLRTEKLAEKQWKVHPMLVLLEIANNSGENSK